MLPTRNPPTIFSFLGNYVYEMCLTMCMIVGQLLPSPPIFSGKLVENSYLVLG